MPPAFYFGPCHVQCDGKVVSTVVSKERLEISGSNPPKTGLVYWESHYELSGCADCAVMFLRFWPTT